MRGFPVSRQDQIEQNELGNRERNGPGGERSDPRKDGYVFQQQINDGIQIQPRAYYGRKK